MGADEAARMRGLVLDRIETSGGFDPDFAVGVRP
jgi:hypothetical protein